MGCVKLRLVMQEKGAVYVGEGQQAPHSRRDLRRKDDLSHPHLDNSYIVILVDFGPETAATRLSRNDVLVCSRVVGRWPSAPGKTEFAMPPQ